MSLLQVRCMISRVLGRLLAWRGELITVGASGVGVVLALALSSPLQPLAVSVSGLLVYFLVILIDPLKGLLMWMVTQVLLERHLNISLGAGVPDLSFTRLCIALVTVLLLARTAIGHQRLQSVSRFDVLALLFMIGTMQSAPRGIGGVSSIQGVFDLYWVPILVCFAVKNLVTSRQSVHLVLYAVLLVALYTAVGTIYETATGNVILATYKTSHFYSDSGLRIVRSIWGGNDSIGRALVLGIPSCFYFYLKASSQDRKAAWAICLALVVIGLFFSYKRSAWLAMVGIVFVMQSFYPQFRRLFITLLIVVSIAIAFEWGSISTSVVYTDRLNSKASTSEGRTEGWEHALDFWRARPLLGHGFRQYRNLAIAAGYKDRAVESEYFDILVSSGLAGFLPFVGLLLLMGYDGLQHYRGRVADGLADRDLVAVFWAGLTGFAITISTAIITEVAIPSMMFAVAGAIIYARRPPQGICNGGNEKRMSLH